MLVLDTDHLSILDRESGAVARRLAAHLSAAAAAGIATTIVNFEEQMRGWMAYLSRAKSVTEQIEAYRRLAAHLQRYRRMTVLDFDERAAVEFQRIRKVYPRVGTMDLKIAAIVLARGDTLLSRSLADFGRISGLKVEDWSSASAGSLWQRGFQRFVAAAIPEPPPRAIPLHGHQGPRGAGTRLWQLGGRSCCVTGP